LVFRLGRAAARFWDARTALSDVIHYCRTACSTSAAAYAHLPAARDDFCRWLAVFPIVLKNCLRSQDRHAMDPGCKPRRLAQLRPLLTEREALRLLERPSFGPITVLDRLRAVALAASSDTAAAESAVRSNSHRNLNDAINGLTGAWGTMERINITPLPYVYVAHLRTILLLYLFMWSITSIAQLGWIVLPGLLASSWALLGIEAAAVECSTPFRRQPNHLLLGQAGITIAEGIAHTLTNIDSEES